MDIIKNKEFSQKQEDLELLGTIIEAEFKTVDEDKN
jgi:hypothetical protein